MDAKINSIVSQLNVSIVHADKMDADGHYIAAINTIVLDSSLSERKEKVTLLHELGHAAKHMKNYELYNLAFSLRSKMEQEAEEFMIEQMVEVRFHDPEFNPEAFNSINFLESYDLDVKYESVVKEFMTRYMTEDEGHLFF
ncbi:ImmA/IrrE family metallo-endopeptidase [Enterococcus casseliflavus]|uniref:ImmA/IrrE family metallo-endopeptidase n=1 Tax=Enterococcus casseliflavus TaxID=37734 RepID=UPI002DBA1A82|nr:ImmA/IrrE family metallo-endopeptidase [Enterococcus casseliflavus]MEB6147354.1 ImmA/IrrE family metallo-endopeptidase [Enterococcus casseliflavus]